MSRSARRDSAAGTLGEVRRHVRQSWPSADGRGSRSSAPTGSSRSEAAPPSGWRRRSRSPRARPSSPCPRPTRDPRHHRGRRKQTGRDEAVRPRTVVYDPDLTRALRVGLDGDDRDRLLYGAALAGWALGVAGTALHHCICHVLGGVYDLPHAETHSAVLPQAAARIERAVPNLAIRLASALGARTLATGVFDLARRSGATTALAHSACARRTSMPPTTAVAEETDLDEATAAALLRDAWAGTRPDGDS